MQQRHHHLRKGMVASDHQYLGRVKYRALRRGLADKAGL